MDIDTELCFCDTEWQTLIEDTLREMRCEAFQMNSLNSEFDLERFILLVRNTYELFLPYYIDLSAPLPRRYLMVAFTILNFAHIDYADQTQRIASLIAHALCDRLNGPAVCRERFTPGKLPVCTRIDLRPGLLPIETTNGKVCVLSLDSFDLTELRQIVG